MTRSLMPNAYTPGAANLAPEDAARIARRTRLLGPAYRLFYAEPLHIVRGDGVFRRLGRALPAVRLRFRRRIFRRGGGHLPYDSPNNLVAF